MADLLSSALPSLAKPQPKHSNETNDHVTYEAPETIQINQVKQPIESDATSIYLQTGGEPIRLKDYKKIT